MATSCLILSPFLVLNKIVHKMWSWCKAWTLLKSGLLQKSFKLAHLLLQHYFHMKQFWYQKNSCSVPNTSTVVLHLFTFFVPLHFKQRCKSRLSSHTNLYIYIYNVHVYVCICMQGVVHNLDHESVINADFVTNLPIFSGMVWPILFIHSDQGISQDKMINNWTKMRFFARRNAKRGCCMKVWSRIFDGSFLEQQVFYRSQNLHENISIFLMLHNFVADIWSELVVEVVILSSLLSYLRSKDEQDGPNYQYR